MDSHSQSELSKAKKRRREEKPEPLPSAEQDQEQGDSKKKRRKKKKSKEDGTESHEHSQVLFVEPLVVATPIPITLEPPKEQCVEPIEATAVHPGPDQRPARTHRKKKKKESVLEPEPEPEPKEPGNTDHSQPPQLSSVKKKKKKKGAELNEAVAEHSTVCLCHEPPAMQGEALPEPKAKELNNAEHPVPDSAPSKDPSEKMKREKRKKEKKSVLEPQDSQPESKEPSITDDSQPQLCSVKKKKKRKGAESNEAVAEHSSVCTEPPAVQGGAVPEPQGVLPEPKPKEPSYAEHPLPESAPEKMKREKEKKSVLERQEAQPESKGPSNTDDSQPQLCSVKKKKKRKGAERNEAVAELATVCPEPPAVQGGALPEPKPKEPSNAEHPVPDSAPEKMKREKEEKSVLEPQEAQPESKGPSNTDDSQPQPCSVKKKKKRKGAERNEAVAELATVCPEPPAVQGGALPEPKPKEPSNAEHPVPDSAPEKMKREKEEKSVLEPQEAQPESKGPSNKDDSQPQPCSVKKKKKRKGAEPNEVVAEHSTVCTESPAVQGGTLPEPKPKDPSNAEHLVPNSAPEKMKLEKEEKSVLEPQEAQPESKGPSNTDDSQPQPCSVKKKKKRKGAEPNEAVAEHSTVCTEPPVVQGGALPEPKPKEPCSTEHPVPDPIPPKDTPKKMKRKKEKKSVLEPQGAQPEPEPEPKEPSNTEHSQPQLCSGKKNKRKEKGAEPNEANAELPMVCPELPLDIAIPTDPEKSKKGAEQNEANAELPPVCLESNAEYPQVCPEPPIDIAIPIDPGNTKSVAEPSEPNAEHSPVCPEPPSDIAILIDPEENKKGAEPNTGLPLVCPEPPFDKATPIDPEKNRKEADPNESNAEHPRVCPEPPLDKATPIDPEKNRKEAEPKESNAEHPRVCPEPPLGLAIPIDPEKNKGGNLTPTDENELNRRNRREELVVLVTSDEKIVTPRDHLVPLKSIPGFVLEQTQPGPVIPVCPKPASLIGQSQTIPVVDTEQKINKKSGMTKRKRMNSMPDGSEPNEHNTKPPESKKRMLDGEEPNERNAKLPETLMLASQRMKKNKRALKSAGSESVYHNSDQNAKTPVQRTQPLKLVEAKSFMASRQQSHKLKSPSKDEEICFFCGEIGHSLGSCSVSRAGGGLRRFTKCLICHAQGHFSYNCTRHGRGLMQSCSYIHSGLQSQQW